MSESSNLPQLRIGARILVLDPADHVLLFSSYDERDGHRFWVPPGGGREGDETAEETARRELWEETAIRDVDDVTEIWRRRGIATWGGVTYDSRERWFIGRVREASVDTSGFTEQEQSLIAGYRWWSIDELTAATERLVPPNLAVLLRELLRDGPPEHPYDLD